MRISTEELLGDWYRRLRFSQFAHYESAKSFEHLNYQIGIPVVVLSAFVGTSVFASLGKVTDEKLQILIGLTSVVTAALASIQTFLRFSERAEKHRIAAAKYGALRRKIEELLAMAGDVTKDATTALRKDMDRLSEEAPHIPERIWSRRQEVIEEDRANSVGLFKAE